MRGCQPPGRHEGTGSVAAKPSGGSISPLEQHAEFLLGLIANQPDLTLNEIVAAMRKRRIARMQELLSPCRLCSNMTEIRSSIHRSE